MTRAEALDTQERYHIMADYMIASGLRIAASDARIAATTAHAEGNYAAAAMARTLAAEFTRTAEKYENEVAA